MISLVQRNNSSQSELGTPMIQAITASGNGAATRSTKSPSVDPFTTPSPSTSRAMRSTSSWRARIARGVKRELTTRRIGPCLGGSIITRISVGGTGPAPSRASVMPAALPKRSGCDATCMMSACLVTAQNGS